MAEVSIFFGSQSGTAECFAEEIHEEASQNGVKTEVLDLRSFSPDSFKAKKIVVFIVSTYGDGEPTDNAVDFHKWACNPNNDGALIGQRFCVMGLGDMNYTKFNNMGTMTDANLERLGGKKIYSRGVGDDSQDIASDFQKWKEGGLWASLQKAVAEVTAEGGFAQKTSMEKAVADKIPLYLYVGHSEADGAAKDVTDSLVEKWQAQGQDAPIRQCLSDRKACEVVRKMPKSGIALVVVDSGPDGLCPNGRKLVRNMNVELDKEGLKSKGVRFAIVTVATSKCNNSAVALKNQIQQNCATLDKAFDRIGASSLRGEVPNYIDAGVDDPLPFLDDVIKSLVKVSSGPAPEETESKAQSAERLLKSKPDEKVVMPVATGARTVILCTGDEAKEAADAIAGSFGNRCSVEDAALVSLAGAAREKTQVVLVVECCESGLSDGSRGLATQLNSVPVSMQAVLRQLKFAMVTVCATMMGNAGERANAKAAQAEVARASDPMCQNLIKMGAKCVSSTCIDLQDADDESIPKICESISEGFAPKKDSVASSQAAGAAAAAAPVKPLVPATPQTSQSGLPELRLESSILGLPAEVEGDPADVLARFYFEADKAKVLKVRELRQQPSLEQGLATVEVELEAKDNLKKYSLGGTLSLLPESDPDDVKAVLPLFGLKTEDLSKYLTFITGAGAKLKRPFPTPCTLGDALSRYCDLARAPHKKMLVAMQAKMKDQEAKARVASLLKDEETLKNLQSSTLCCRMHEFWALLGVTNLDLGDFLLNCPRQKAREFTIASSPKATPEKITLCVSLSSHELPDLTSTLETLKEKGIASPSSEAPSRNRFFGACSRWLASRLKTGDMVLAKQRPSPLKLPEKDVPKIMIGAGAGVAPFRGFWEELRKGSQTAPAVLFFGCRHPEQDWIFKDEMNTATKINNAALARMQVGPKRPLAALYPAFSRPENPAQKKYVQDAIREQSSMVKAGMAKDGVVFICGSTAMGTAVFEALGDILEGGKETVEDLRKQGRIVAEMWG
jgi:sulfite reductase alpha subunit-like flavoprotein